MLQADFAIWRSLNLLTSSFVHQLPGTTDQRLLVSLTTRIAPAVH
jgi:hypothetical protein